MTKNGAGSLAFERMTRVIELIPEALLFLTVVDPVGDQGSASS